MHLEARSMWESMLKGEFDEEHACHRSHSEPE